MTTRLFIGKGCPECERLMPHVPEGVEIFDTSTSDGMAEAMFESVYSVPTVIAEGRRYSGFHACTLLFKGGI